MWLFRLLALVLAPAVFFGVLELGLRLAGVGHPASFLLPLSHNGRELFVQNNQFGWRFFGRELARWPYPLAIAQAKPTNTVRIMVLGESAARGEPEPDFGLPRVLEAMLSLHYPGVRFEVVNTAMTAINSHAILPIARDCARAGGDIWVIYMGNNEVVGPFGAGTVFGSQSPPLPLIRASLAVKATRTGQALDAVLARLRATPHDESVWGGMSLFLEQQVPADDPRLEGVYQHFEQNLADIIKVGRRSGAGIVVSTVAVNLKDCAPFASAHKTGLSSEARARWDQLYSLGVKAQQAGDLRQAMDHFQAAAKLDDRFADLRFRQAQCALALGETVEAQGHFRAARDLDTLRFRCDSRLNELIRQAVTNSASDRVLLAEAEGAVIQRSADGLPGETHFYEHVHFNYEGNYLLAWTLADQVRRLLPEWALARGSASGPWPSPGACARRLGRNSWHEAAALNSILTTLNDPPFPGQLNHREQMQRLEARLAQLTPALSANGVREALQACATASAESPDDPVLHKQIATLKRTAGDFPGAVTAARRTLDLRPNDSETWSLLGSVLARQQQREEAAAAFRRAFQLGPQGIKSRLDLAAALETLGKHEEAIRECQHILDRKPRCVPALLQLGQIMEKQGRKSDAEGYYHEALRNRSQRLPELIELGRFFQSRGMAEAAVQVYRDAVALNASDPKLQLTTGRALAALARYPEAAQYSAEAVRLAPDLVEAHLLHGIVQFRLGQTTQAVVQFQEALRLQPGSVDAKLNLGMVLAKLGRKEEALAWFDGVLQQNPTNAVALQYVKSLRAGDNATP